MIQGGDPTATGGGGESCWGEDFADEFDPTLGNLRGSLAMANAGPGTNGSQFFINEEGLPGGAVADGAELYAQNETMLKQNGYATLNSFLAARYGLEESKLSDKVIDVYKKTGGNIHLDGPLRASGGHTVFGQVFEGMDVVDAIAASEGSGHNVVIKNIAIETAEKHFEY